MIVQIADTCARADAMPMASPGNSRLSFPQGDFLAAFAPELVDWWGRPVQEYRHRIVQLDEKHWFVKCKPDLREQKRDYLAYILGRRWTNIAEVRPLLESELDDLRHFGVALPGWATIENTNLVRMVGDYRVDQLPHTDITAAVAHELMFSLWTRRRDTHAANRAYINGVPVFFDHQTAFLGEPHLIDIDVFFQHGEDAGHAGRWRVELPGPRTIISTAEMRRSGRARNVAIHMVQDLPYFNDCLEDAAEKIRSQNPQTWFQAARTAGFSIARASRISTFLERNCAALAAETRKMRSVIFRH